MQRCVHWLFDNHAQDVLRTLPGASRSRTFQVLNPAEPGQPRWLTLIESEDIIATWQHRCFSADTGARDAATARGVSNRREYYVGPSTTSANSACQPYMLSLLVSTAKEGKTWQKTSKHA